jgi:hypothetical protein
MVTTATALLDPVPMFSPKFRGQAPEHLDLRTGLGFLFSGLGTLGCGGHLVRPLIVPGTLQRANSKWRRDLARKGLWTRFTATESHSAPFTVGATVLSLLYGYASYRNKLREGRAELLPFMMVYVSGQIFPDLPFFGLARAPRGDRWLRVLAILALATGAVLASSQLRSALMSEEQYQEKRRQWEKHGDPNEGRDAST